MTCDINNYINKDEKFKLKNYHRKTKRCYLFLSLN